MCHESRNTTICASCQRWIAMVEMRYYCEEALRVRRWQGCGVAHEPFYHDAHAECDDCKRARRQRGRRR